MSTSRYREMIEMLLPVTEDNSQENDVEKEEGVLECLDSLQQKFEQGNPLLGKQTMVSKVTVLLRELVLTHRWTDMIHAVSGIASNVEAAPDILHNLGFEGFLQEPTTSLVLFKKLVEELKILKEYDCHEVIMEYFLFMTISCQEEYDSSLNVKVKPKKLKSRNRKKMDYFETLYKGHEGFIHYIEWCKLRYMLQKNGQEMQYTENGDYKVSDHMVNVEQDKQQMLVHSERACECFKVSEERHGVWDLFIGKHVEMLEYHEQVKDAEIIIEEYVHKTPDNPYSLNLLYEFYTRNKYDINLRISTLEKLCDKVGFDSCVLTLYTLYKQTDMCPAKSLPILFKLMDYPDWKDDFTVWKYFCQDIAAAFENEDIEILKEMWEQRKDWWKLYHFTFKAEHADDLLYLKALAASYLISPDADYVDDVIKCGKLNQDQISHIKQINTTMDNFDG